MPTVTEIVLVIKRESLSRFRQDVADLSLGRIDALEVFLVPMINQFRISVSFAIDLEVMKMTIPLAHCRLDAFMQFVERAVSGLYSSPDRRVRSEQCDLELVQPVGGWN